MKRVSDEDFVKHVIESLDAANDDLDPITQARLRAARLHAASSTNDRRRSAWGSWPVTAAVLSLAVVVGIWAWRHEDSLSADRLVGVAELAALDDGIDLYEDLDFYVWLSEQQADG